MTNEQLLLSISEMLDQKINPIQKDISEIKTQMVQLDGRISNIEDTVNNDVLPRISSIEDTIDHDVLPRIKRIEIRQENDVLPRLSTIEACYTSTYDRYKRGADDCESMKEDISTLKQVVAEHSIILKRIS